VLPITFQNKVIITDIDGDQLRIDNDGTGSSHLGIPGFPFQGSGGPLRGTYVLTSATGKYSGWKVGSTFSYRAIATNPPNPPGALGTVYAEVSYRETGRQGLTYGVPTSCSDRTHASREETGDPDGPCRPH
jgi:hypothetical protein